MGILRAASSRKSRVISRPRLITEWSVVPQLRCLHSQRAPGRWLPDRGSHWIPRTPAAKRRIQLQYNLGHTNENEKFFFFPTQILNSTLNTLCCAVFLFPWHIAYKWSTRSFVDRALADSGQLAWIAVRHNKGLHLIQAGLQIDIRLRSTGYFLRKHLRCVFWGRLFSLFFFSYWQEKHSVSTLILV